MHGINHITFSVSDLTQSMAFYSQVIGAQIKVSWNNGAYLEYHGLWLCLSKGTPPAPSRDYSHIAFSASPVQFTQVREQIACGQVMCWQENKSEGDSLYILDPDGHRLELHQGDLTSRLMSLQASHYEGLKWYDDPF